jgi:hypothetical protein
MADQFSVSDFDFEADRLKDLSSQQAHALDRQLHIQFYKHAELNSFATREEGRKIFEEHVYIRILTPANRLNIIERRATDDDKIRFEAAYAKFLTSGEQLQTGTPLSELPGMSAAQVLEMRHLKVETIEQLAGIPDTTAQLLGAGGQELKQRALRYLARFANAENQANEIADLRAKLEMLLAERAKTQVVASTDVKVSDTVVTPAAAKA